MSFLLRDLERRIELLKESYYDTEPEYFSHQGPRCCQLTTRARAHVRAHGPASSRQRVLLRPGGCTD